MIGSIIFLVIILSIFSIGWYMFREGMLVANSISNSIPIEYEAWKEGHLPLITLTSQHGIKYTFLVDTGANSNYIASELLVDFNEEEQNVLSKESFFGADGTDMAGTNHRIQFTHRNVKLTDEYMATGMDALRKLGESLKQPVHGIIGTPFLRHHGLTVDLNRMIVWKKL